MKKIILCVETNSAGGAERVIANLANFFSKQGHNVIVVNGDSDSNFYQISHTVKVIKLGFDRLEKGRLSKAVLHYKELKKIFIREKPDAIVAFLFNMEAPAILAGIVTKTDVYTSVRNSANVYPKSVRIFRRLFYPFISGVIFQSENVKNCIDFKRVKNKCVIMNPLANDFECDVSIISKSARKKWIITAGRLTPQKNHKILIQSFADVCNDFPEYELHIFGEGILREELTNYIKQLNMEQKVFLEGELNNAILINRDAYGFVLSSDYEGFPNALVEAMAVGIPVISTDFDSGVASELIDDGVNGYICNVGDYRAMSNKLRNMLELSEEDYTNMVKNEIQIASLLSNDSIGKQWEAFVL
ncbi:Glycosyltransferase involved in cell wall bisynthesis [Kandleria vitulina]|uniref:Glycosyltransferase involved in cell wall bisynthesis n=1 Tax=Kandleria vitulina TaxID=1630 RepID=A0A1H2VPW8_9FIRM|nr:glycosyltransferase [Kandleria vitulina]SDW69899.1 Glycosyltransferase involved in cell wall bisynthesis [Kandleria vitulina]